MGDLRTFSKDGSEIFVPNLSAPRLSNEMNAEEVPKGGFKPGPQRAASLTVRRCQAKLFNSVCFRSPHMLPCLP